jgi:sulfur carrier protein ThiS
MAIKIQLKTGGLLGEYLPAGSARNTAEVTVDDNATPLDVMKQLGMPLEDNYLVSLNGSVVTRKQRSSQPFAENDRLVIMPPLKGG